MKINLIIIYSLILIVFFENIKADCRSDTLIRVHENALQLYKNAQFSNAVSTIDDFFDNHAISETKIDLPDSQYAEILNDYAFFMQRYYEEQAKEFCKGTEKTTVHDFFNISFTNIREGKRCSQLCGTNTA